MGRRLDRTASMLTIHVSCHVRLRVAWIMIKNPLHPSWKQHCFRAIVRAGTLAACLTMSAPVCMADVLSDQLSALRTIQPGDEKGLQQAASIAKQLSSSKELSLVQVLSAMKGASPIGKNWLVGLANGLHRKSPATQTAELEKFLADKTQDGEARYTVFRWLTDGNEERKTQWLEEMLFDPSLEIRFDAVARALASSEEIDQARLTTLLDAARHPEQVAAIIARLGKAGVEVDQAKHLGFLTRWDFIGPFDNIGSKNFDKVYPVETDWTKNQLAESYEGKTGKVTWAEGTSESPEGALDLAKIFNKEKGCIVYGKTTVNVPSDVDCEIRVGCINAQKVWVNGELVIANEVYHTGMQIDQYAVPVRLKAGENRILIKVCQNEQKEAWAQLFTFQARLCDSTGKAISLAP